jgi:hypothetical protein
MTTSNLPDPSLDRIERGYRRSAQSFAQRHAAVLGLGVFGALLAAFVASMTLTFEQVRVLRHLHFVLVLAVAAVPAASFLRERRAVRRGLSTLPTMTIGAATGWSGRVLLRGRLRCIEPGISFVFHDPKSPGVVGWIDDPDLSAWIAHGGKLGARSSASAIGREDDVTLQAHATALTDVPPMLQRWLSDGSYREPPRIVHLTSSIEEPLRIVLHR